MYLREQIMTGKGNQTMNKEFMYNVGLSQPHITLLNIIFYYIVF